MTVNPSAVAFHVKHKGKTYYFCSKHCSAEFKQDPAKYTGKAADDSPLVSIGASTAPAAPVSDSSTKQKDPVCGMDVDPATARHRFDHAGKTYYFCCGGCLERFRSDPDRYLNPNASANLVQLAEPAPPVPRQSQTAAQPQAERYYVCPMCPDVREKSPVPCPSCGMALEPETLVPISKIEYTCPMHPEIIRSEPGSCPICGMTLEPRTVTAHEEENPELRNMTPPLLGQPHPHGTPTHHRHGRHASRHAAATCAALPTGYPGSNSLSPRPSFSGADGPSSSVDGPPSSIAPPTCSP